MVSLRRSLVAALITLFMLPGCGARMQRSFGDVVQREVSRSLSFADLCGQLEAAAPTDGIAAADWFESAASFRREAADTAAGFQSTLADDAERAAGALLSRLPSEVQAACPVRELIGAARGGTGGCTTALQNLTGDWNARPAQDAAEDALRSVLRSAAGDLSSPEALAEGLLQTAARLDFSAPLLQAILRALDATSDSLDRLIDAVPYGRSFSAVLRPPMERLMARSLAWSLERLVLRPSSDPRRSPVAAVSRGAMALHACEVLQHGTPRTRLSRLYLEQTIRAAAGDRPDLPTRETACAGVTTWPARQRCHSNFARLNQMARNTALELEVARACGSDDSEACRSTAAAAVEAAGLGAEGHSADDVRAARDAFDAFEQQAADEPTAREAVSAETLAASLAACPSPCSVTDVGTVGGILLRDDLQADEVLGDAASYRAWMRDELAATRLELAGLRGDVAQVQTAVDALAERVDALADSSDGRLRATLQQLDAARGSIADLERMLGRLDGACGTQIDRVIQARAQLVAGLGLCVSSATRATLEQSSTLVELFSAAGAVPACNCAAGSACALDSGTGQTLFSIPLASLRSLDAPIQVAVPSDGMFEECVFESDASAAAALLDYLATHPIAGRTLSITGATGWSDPQRPSRQCAARVAEAAAASPICGVAGLEAERPDERTNRQLACLRAESVWRSAQRAGLAGASPERPLDGRIDTSCADGDTACLSSARRVDVALRADGRGAELPLHLDYDSCR